MLYHWICNKPKHSEFVIDDIPNQTIIKHDIDRIPGEYVFREIRLDRIKIFFIVNITRKSQNDQNV